MQKQNEIMGNLYIKKMQDNNNQFFTTLKVIGKNEIFELLISK